MGAGATSSVTTVYEAQQYARQLYARTKAGTKAERAAARREYNGLVSALRQYWKRDLDSPTSVEDAWKETVKSAADIGSNVMELLAGGQSGTGSGSGSGRGRGSAPALPLVDRMAEADIALIANEEAMGLLGRELSKAELKSIVQTVRGLEDANPQEIIVRNGRQIRRGGVSAATLQDLIQERTAAVVTKGLDAAGELAGDAARQVESLRQWTRDNGVGLSDNAISNYTRRILRGETTMDDVKADLRRTYLSGAFPAWADRINAGEDPADFLSPYVRRAQDLLEREDVGLNDPLVKRMTQYVGADGKPAVLPLYEADRLARKDDRWQYTNNAQAEYARAADRILSMFGFR